MRGSLDTGLLKGPSAVSHILTSRINPITKVNGIRLYRLHRSIMPLLSTKGCVCSTSTRVWKAQEPFRCSCALLHTQKISQLTLTTTKPHSLLDNRCNGWASNAKAHKSCQEEAPRLSLWSIPNNLLPIDLTCREDCFDWFFTSSSNRVLLELFLND